MLMDKECSYARAISRFRLCLAEMSFSAIKARKVLRKSPGVAPNKAVITMEHVTQDTCDETCSGTETDLQSVKNAMIGEDTILALSEIFKALGDPTRVRIINALMQRELCVHDLTVVLEMGQSAVSHQLRVLRNMRIVKRRKVGKTVYYSLDDSHIEQIITETIRHIQHG